MKKKIQIRFSHTGEVLKVNIIKSNSAVGLTINYLQPSENYSRVYKLFTISKYANIPNHITQPKAEKSYINLNRYRKTVGLFL